jgi:PleD family two-component response regulator
VSIGVAHWTREMGLYPDRLIAAADHALYDAKKAGRNGFATYVPALPPEATSMPDIDLRKRA